MLLVKIIQVAFQKKIKKLQLFFIEIAPMLLARGADPDCQDKYGHAPIHRAASKGYEKMVQILLQVSSVSGL